MTSIVNGLRTSVTNLDALKSGEVVGSFSKTFLAPDKSFALYPDLQVDDSDLVTVDLWAECKSCENIDNTFGMTKLSQLTALPIEELESIFQKRASIFLLVLRVYKLPIPIQVQHQSTGNFIPLPEIVTISEKLPILDDEQFQEVQEPLIIVPEPPSDSFGEDDNFIIINPNPLPATPPIPPLTNSPDINDLSWIQTISTLGDRSIELEEKKTTYQAGTDFENITKQALQFLGFTIDYAHKGGAGGLDLLCLKPYPLFGECKAGKSIPNDTVVQLLNLGTIRNNELFQKTGTVKLIIGSGKPTQQVIDGANVHKMAIMHSITLQKLVELKAKYDGAVNLFELKKYLQAGQIDNKIKEYIQKVESEIKLRSRIVQAVKRLADMGTTQPNFERICTQYNAMFFTDNESILHDHEVRDYLIELSSPLAGYLGRDKSDEGKGDRFYYLRDLPCNT